MLVKNIRPHNDSYLNVPSSLSHSRPPQNNPNVHHLDERVDKHVTATEWTIIQPQKGMRSRKCYAMDEPQKHFKKWTKPGTKDHVLCNWHCYQARKTSTHRQKVGQCTAWGCPRVEQAVTSKQAPGILWGRMKQSNTGLQPLGSTSRRLLKGLI